MRSEADQVGSRASPPDTLELSTSSRLLTIVPAASCDPGLIRAAGRRAVVSAKMPACEKLRAPTYAKGQAELKSWSGSSR